MISGVYWNQGKRELNQDSLVLEQALTNKGRILLAAVSDGIGGLSEGETASGLAAEKLVQEFYHQILPLAGKGRGMRYLKRSLLRCLFETGQMLGKYGRSKEISLGATVSVLLIFRSRFLIVHLGDSRIYCLQKRKNAVQITKDHRSFPNALTKCIGSFPYQIPDIYQGRIRGKTGFLLCTDGFYHSLNEDMLTEILNPREIKEEVQIEKRLKGMAEYCSRQGEQDNISALYVVCNC